MYMYCISFSIVIIWSIYRCVLFRLYYRLVLSTKYGEMHMIHKVVQMNAQSLAWYELLKYKHTIHTSKVLIRTLQNSNIHVVTLTLHTKYICPRFQYVFFQTKTYYHWRYKQRAPCILQLHWTEEHIVKACTGFVELFFKTGTY